ncbi:hypothetical protein EN962_13225 [Mesorhizobium sp. M7A.F.Ca.CA.001.09.2.1]|uniref:Uncharacterized protein n=2 Tax=Mesorhizobium ciceri TaxID=39645 RepID=E8TG06_MESCW|nr:MULTISPECIES: hypothetical protein [Mesorhizobium]RUY38132.1 hypothetical protein EN981_24015 [Mesorhizobium sp. M7A.F.Ca.CA.001.13.2.1]RUZ72481.1 hypothetical protein EN947_27340 [Mesorhizobium sp. M7A.F.Ca.US.003.02.2.1]RVA47099.1 hypothetical protein EN933_20665 [Mesorhizobium sp. M7A.F.Ca.US.001.01.1.1]ADV11148.1 hypothetical protein Mesci_1995 [Mesorhizobium ciceri biovar biserrulae WSM1271]ARP63747.1 hypothetical protein A9K65_010400 [Mesorhizobium sp. WSM1497]
MKFNFDEPPGDDVVADTSAECQRQLLPLVREIVQAAVAAGWSEEDVLLGFVELAWDLYENRRDDLQ